VSGVLFGEQPFEHTVNFELFVVVQRLEEFLVVDAEVGQGGLPAHALVLVSIIFCTEVALPGGAGLPSEENAAVLGVLLEEVVAVSVEKVELQIFSAVETGVWTHTQAAL